MNRIEMYGEFRKEIERFSIPLALSHRDMVVHDIEYEGKIVGIFCVAYGEYIDCIYIQPEYRRRGLAKDTVLNWAKGNRNIQLNIINTNAPAKAFWNSVFELRKVDSGEVDTLYEVVKIKGDEDV